MEDDPREAQPRPGFALEKTYDWGRAASARCSLNFLSITSVSVVLSVRSQPHRHFSFFDLETNSYKWVFRVSLLETQNPWALLAQGSVPTFLVTGSKTALTV